MTRDESPERVPDWLLGGRVRRRVFERLTDKRGWKAKDLAEKIDAGEATVFEMFRALKPLGALEPTGPRGAYRLTQTGIGGAIRKLVASGRPHAEEPVARPAGRVKRQ
jgi:hypothetical protein